MKDLGPLHYFVGVEVCHNHSGLLLTQSKHISSLLDCVAMVDCKLIPTPVTSASHLSLYDGDLFYDPTTYYERLVPSSVFC